MRKGKTATVTGRLVLAQWLSPEDIQGLARRFGARLSDPWVDLVGGGAAELPPEHSAQASRAEWSAPPLQGLEALTAIYAGFAEDVLHVGPAVVLSTSGGTPGKSVEGAET